MKQLRLKVLFVIVNVLFLFGCSKQDDRVELHIVSAASLMGAMSELIEMYEREHEEIRIIPNYGSSGQLKSQIANGAPADLFLPAATRWTDELEKTGLIIEKANLVNNRLVLVSSANFEFPIQKFEDLTSNKVRTISIGQPETVPAGEYAKQSLKTMNLFDELEQKLVYGNDVRQVLTYVETGNVDAGIVYYTDAILSENIKIITFAEVSTHEDIIYPLALLNTSEEARNFYNWLQTPAAKNVFTTYGFQRM